jgi:Flp pilus assembly protein TadG
MKSRGAGADDCENQRRGGHAGLCRRLVEVGDRPSLKVLQKARSDRGQTLVEFALTLPILALFLVAIVELGLVLNTYVEVTHAARVGARKASVLRSDEGGITKAITSARESTSSVDKTKLDVFVTPRPWPKGSPVEVRVTYPVSIDILGFVVKSGELEAEATARSQ